MGAAQGVTNEGMRLRALRMLRRMSALREEALVVLAVVEVGVSSVVVVLLVPTIRVLRSLPQVLARGLRGRVARE